MKQGIVSETRHGTGCYVMDKRWKKGFVLHTDIEGIHSPLQNMIEKKETVFCHRHEMRQANEI